MMRHLALGAVISLTGVGCSGINTSQGFSPLMFFLPGWADNKAAPQPIAKPALPAVLTNSPPTLPPAPMASQMELALLN
jgi:hypothetical protein